MSQRSEQESEPIRTRILFLLTVWRHRLHGKDMCVNIYDVRLDDESPACGMNWPPEIRNVTDYLGVCYFSVRPGNC